MSNIPLKASTNLMEATSRAAGIMEATYELLGITLELKTLSETRESIKAIMSVMSKDREIDDEPETTETT